MPWFSILVLIGVVLLIPTAYAGKIGAPYAPTRIAAVRRAFKEIELSGDDVLVDLGAGDGKILLKAALSGAQAEGYELSPILWVIAKLRTFTHRRIRLYYRNFYKADLSRATVIFSFLMPQNMPRVRQFLKQQTIPKGTYFLSYAFPFKDADLEPLSVIREPNCAPLYIYDLRQLTAGKSSQ